MSTLSKVAHFALREAQEAIHLYFEPVQRSQSIFSAWLDSLVWRSLRSTREWQLAPASRLARESKAGQFKIALVGDMGVGKTSLIDALIGRRHSRAYAAPPRYSEVSVHEWHHDVVLFDLPSLEDLSVSEEHVVSGFLHRETDLILFVLDASGQWSDRHVSQIHRLLIAGKPMLVLLSRADLVPEAEMAARMKEVERIIGFAPVPVSAQTGLNVVKIRGLLLSRSND